MGSSVSEADFEPTTTGGLSSNATNAASDINTVLNIPSFDDYNPAASEDGAGANTCSDTIDNGGGDGADQNDPECYYWGDYNFSAVVTTTPAAMDVRPGPGHPSHNGATDPILGDIAATLASDTNLGLNNGSCNTNLNVPFTMLNATVDNSPANEIDPIPQANTGPLGTLENMATDDGSAPGATPNPGAVAPANGLPASVDLYPSYLNLIFDDLQPLRRMTGNTIVAGSQVTLHFMVFEPGALAAHFDPPHPFSDFDASMGYTSVSILQDPTVPAAPSSITDFCSLLTSDAITLGTTEGNACNGTTASPCNTTSGIGAPASDGDNTGRVAQTNPGSAGTYLYTNFVQGLRDVDGDGLENAFDTCPFDFNVDGNPRLTNGPDGDALDSACDPTPGTNTGSGNHDGDTTGSPARAWNNGGDNCPLAVNADQADAEGLDDDVGGPPYVDSAPRGGPKSDAVGDVCDPDDVIANGQFHTALNVSAQCIGGTDGDGDGWCATGGGQPNDPNDGNINATPEAYSVFFPMPVAHSGSGVNPNVGGTILPGFGLDICDAVPGPPTGGLHAGCDAASPNTQSGQPYQVCNDGIDNDLDTQIDTNDSGCTPSGLSPVDTDGDGFSDEAEIWIGTDALGRCEVGAPTPSTDWPADVSASGGSADRVTLGDLTAFLFPAPAKFGSSPGSAGWDQRFDINPSRSINLSDLTAMLFGSSGNPPMYSGIGDGRAFGNVLCTAHPIFGD